MARKHTTDKSKSNKIINFSIISGKIFNSLYKEDQQVSETEITSSPGAAFFDREGRVLDAL